MADGKPDVIVIDGSDGVWVHARSYDVSVWPPEIECMDSDTWKLTVEYRGAGRWAVTRGGWQLCLGSDGEWDRERIPSERDDEWLATHRFALAEAIALAHEHAPKVTINDMTALEVLARHRARHPDGKCRG
jgi:hypothetical protein